MGHALNKILKDIINRYHVSVGERVQYVCLFTALYRSLSPCVH